MITDKYKSCKNPDEPYIFISYAHEDFEKIEPYMEVLENNSFRYWYDEGLPSGKDFYEQISQHIKKSIQFLVFVSAKSQESENVKDEIHIAYKYKKNMLVVFIEDVDLCDGLELVLDRKQSIYAYRYEEETRYKKFYSELIKDALKKQDVADESVPAINSVTEEDLLTKYDDFKLLSKSGMSEVYSARQISTGCKVMIKKVTYSDNENSSFFRRCICNEVRALKICQCPFIPKLIDFCENDEKCYIVETFINGESLDIDESYNEDFVINFAIKTAQILKYLYYYGIVHCDIKPSNLLVNELSDVFLVDFGSCSFVGEEAYDGAKSGTYGFAAPEQYNKKAKIDFRSDIYSLGKTMLSLLVNDKMTSQNVFKNSTTAVSLETEVFANPMVKVQYMTESLDYYDRTANSTLNAIICKMTSSQKENRYHSLDALISALEKCRAYSVI